MLGILYALSPMVVSALTGALKNLPAFTSLSDVARTPAIRVLAALIAVVYSLATLWVTGNLDQGAFLVAVNTLIEAFIAWIGSLGVFHAFFQKKA